MRGYLLRKCGAVLFSILLVTVLVLTGCGSQSTASNGAQDSGNVSSGKTEDGPASGGKPVKWDFVLFVSLEHPNGKMAVDFANLVKEKTGGKLDITVRPANELPYKPDEYIRATGQNSMQMADAFIPFVSGDLQAGALTTLPFLVSSTEELDKTMEVLNPYLDEELNKYGTQLLYYYPWPPQNLWGKRDKPVTAIDQIANMKFRSQGPEQAAFLQAQKAFPVSLSTPEVPTAMQRGVADGVITAALNVEGSKWYDFLNWGYTINLQTPPSYIVVNKQALNQLPDDVRQTLLDTAAEFQKGLADREMKVEQDSIDKLVKEHHITINQAPQEEIQQLIQSSLPYWDQWTKDRGGKAAEALAKVREALGK